MHRKDTSWGLPYVCLRLTNKKQQVWKKSKSQICNNSEMPQIISSHLLLTVQSETFKENHNDPSGILKKL